MRIKFKFSTALMALLSLSLLLVSVSCSGDDDGGGLELSRIPEIEKNILGQWNLKSRINVYSDQRSENTDMNYYKLVFTLNSDRSFKKEVYDYSLSKQPITSASKITRTIEGVYLIEEGDDNQYLLHIVTKYGASYFKIQFSNNNKELRLDEVNKTSSYITTHEVYEKMSK